ncbi:MAG: phosphoenolpyruvate carboxykinase [ATP] [Planctomycetota bacterium]|nr:MAG: phosphoenolpyruvate carboxykinase [ATP] [Planctomycetota bacterium]
MQKIEAGSHLDLEPHGIEPAGIVIHNAPVAELCEHAIQSQRARLGAEGQIVVGTAPFTGRSPEDKFFVREPSSEREIDWGPINRPLAEEHYRRLLAKIRTYLGRCEPLFVQDAYACADPRRRLRVRLISESAWHALFAHHMFLRPGREELASFAPDWTIYHAPGLRAEPAADGTRSGTFIVCHLGERTLLIGGTSYAGEIKKGVFTVLNYALPLGGVLSMHCSANKRPDGSEVALFFGLSGTGKTTLSSDPERTLIGDDEHGWGEDGIFNFEGGCYAKVIRLSAEAEPAIWRAVHRFGTVVENVVLEPGTRRLLLDDDSITENTRAAYPVTYLSNMDPSGRGDHPRHLVLLTCDAFAVLPPLARLHHGQAMYHFLSGYTAKVAGTERGVTEPRATFSACFGAPFLPLAPERYAALLGERLARHQVRCWLVNTGWTGGPFGVGRRISIAHTRALLRAALSGALDGMEASPDPVFGLEIPARVEGVPQELLQPRRSWNDPAAYDARAAELARRFRENFERFASRGSRELAACGPRLP